MITGQQTRHRWRGREQACRLLVGAGLFAVPWVVAQVLQWPVWARAVLGGSAAALLVPELRARNKRDDDLATLVAHA